MEHSELEEKILKKKPKKSRQVTIFVVTLAVIGIGLLAGGLNLINGVSADTAATATATASTIANPPVPGDPTTSPQVDDLSGKFTFPAGWSMVSGLSLQNRDFALFKTSGLILYSFNDPLFPNRDFSTMPAGINSTEQGAIPIAPLGYYVYNAGTASVNLTLPISATPLRPDQDSEIFARGWHLLYWPAASTTREDLLSKIELTYSDQKTETAAQAVNSSEHKISAEVYVVVNQNSISQSGTSKLLGDATTETTLGKIPEKSYFWLYLRRTKERVTNISVNVNPVTQNDQKLIEAWLLKNNYDGCGNPATAATATTTATSSATATATVSATVTASAQATTTCQFSGTDLTADQLEAKYEFLILKFPSKPWASQ